MRTLAHWDSAYLSAVTFGLKNQAALDLLKDEFKSIVPHLIVDHFYRQLLDIYFILCSVF